VDFEERFDFRIVPVEIGGSTSDVKVEENVLFPEGPQKSGGPPKVWFGIRVVLPEEAI